MTKLITIGDFNLAWADFSRRFPPGSRLDTSRINPYFDGVAKLFRQTYPREGVIRIDALNQKERLPASLEKACETWLEATERVTGWKFSPPASD